MKTLLLSFAFALVLAFTFAACMTVPAAEQADAVSQDSSCGNCSVDNGNPGTDTSSGAGEVAQQQPETSTPPCVDLDKDGYCDNGVATAGKPGDCNDNDPSVHPGAVEICDNSKDDNCNGQTDEGCILSNWKGVLSIRVGYQNSLTRVLNAQTASSKSDIGKWWNSSSNSTSTSVEVKLNDLEIPASKCLYVRFNVSEGSPATSWLCEGNGSTANIDPDATIEVKYFDKVYTKSGLLTWSAPGGTNSGCSALLVLSFGANCSL